MTRSNISVRVQSPLLTSLNTWPSRTNTTRWAKEAAKANRLFDGAFGAAGAADEARLFRTVPLRGTSGRGPEVERACLSVGVRVFHSDRFAVARGAKDAFLRVSLCSAGGPGRLRRGLATLHDAMAQFRGAAECLSQRG